MKRDLPDRSQTLFGRQPDLDYLLQRTDQPGLTAIVGRPMMGKSWLLTELARQLSIAKPPAPSILAQPPILVGYTEAEGETADLLLRSVVDLYSRWLSNSTYWEQAQITYQQQNKDLLGKAGVAFGTLFEKLSKLGSKPGEAVGSLVKEAFENLASANRDLLTGGIQLPRLQIDQARDLLSLVHKITGCRIVLVFDQWEKSTGIQLESNILDSFLRHLDEWPPCHIVLGLRPEENPAKAIKKLQKERPGSVEIYDVPPMHFDSAAAAEPLLQYVREHISMEAAVTDEDLLEMISGYPGTIYVWTGPSNAMRRHSLADLKKLADDAHAARFVEFEVLLPQLSDTERCLAIRLSLLPECRNRESWEALKSIAMEKAQTKDLDTLYRKRVLDSAAPRTYGHPKRHEAAQKWLIANFREELKETCEHLVFSLSDSVRDLSPSGVPNATSLVDLRALASSLELSSPVQALCESAQSLFGDADGGKLLVGAAEFRGRYSKAAPLPLLAMGLLNTMYYAKQEDNVSLRDALLDELRHLHQAYPADSAVLENLAKGLFNTLNHAKQEDNLSLRDALLDELRHFHQAYPADPAVRQRLAKGLFIMLIDAKQEDNLSLRDALPNELRRFHQAYPADPAVREWLARGLFNTLIDANEENNFSLRDALLDELRHLHQAYPADPAVRECLANGLLITLIDANHEDNLSLRNLHQADPADSALRERLAEGLFSRLIAAKQEDQLGRRYDLLAELRELAQAYPEDATVRWFLDVLSNS